MTRFDRDAVLERLTVDQVAETYGIAGRWAGRWLRSRRCPTDHHSTDAFGLSREGKWHCWSCDTGGGDLLSLIALAEGLDCRADFPALLEIAAGIAGVEPEVDFGEAPAPTRRPRAVPPAPPVEPIADRLQAAQRRADWVWNHLKPPVRAIETGRHPYLEERGIRWALLPATAREDVRELGFWTVPGDYEALIGLVGTEPISRTFRAIYSGDQGLAIAVRHIDTGLLCDVRARRYAPAAGAPKILGMPGGLTVDARDFGSSDLVACYGWPHALTGDLVIVVEGWADYLTACLRWPHASVLGAVDAGQYPLVAAFAARYLAERGRGRLVLVAQDDGEREHKSHDGTIEMVPGAADRAVNAASKRAIALLGPESVGWIEARPFGVKDLNDIARAGRLRELPEKP